VFDASAVLALLQAETGTEKLREHQRGAVVIAVNAAEVLAKLVSRGMPQTEARAAFNALHLEVLPFEPDLAAISAKYVKKGVSLGDRCFLAAAYHYGYGWTSDHDLPKLLGSSLPPIEFFR
jgi:PIN domain nuclease of toxin-antitoxin system